MYRKLVARRNDLRRAFGAKLEHSARELLASGTTVLFNGADRIDVQLVRFWNRSAIMDARLAGPSGSGRTYTLIDRWELANDPASRLAKHLLSAMVNLQS